MENIDFILDGEIMAFATVNHFISRNCKNDFAERMLQDKSFSRSIVYAVFDITFINQEQTIMNPLKQRKEILSKILFRGTNH